MDAEKCLQGAGLGLDLTRRKKQSALKSAGLPWTASKSFAGSAIVGPLVSIDEYNGVVLDEVSFQLTVNNELRQTGHVNQMIFDIPAQLR